jgi:myo-inositol-1(or 4)-monophosphatase
MTLSSDTHADLDLLREVAEIAVQAGDRLLKLFDDGARPSGRQDMFQAGQANEVASLDGLPETLAALRPGAGWVDDEHETVRLPDGEWWSVDAVEGNVNHVHGLPEWAVTITLLRDNVPVLAVVRQPIGDLTYTALRGEGAFLNGRPLRTSAKTDLDAAVVATGQAEAGQESTYHRIGSSIAAMLGHALLVRAAVPSTFPMLHVAAGHADAFWQYAPVLPGVAAGVLLVTEAGGVATDLHGRPWAPGAADLLVAAPGVHAAALDVLSRVDTDR